MTATVEELTDAVAHLNLSELERLSTSVLAQLHDKGKAGRHFQESILLLAISETLDEAILSRYEALIALRRAEQLTETEHRELLTLTATVEGMDARRLELLAQLAALRRVPLSRVFADLKLVPKPV